MAISGVGTFVWQTQLYQAVFGGVELREGYSGQANLHRCYLTSAKIKIPLSIVWVLSKKKKERGKKVVLKLDVEQEKAQA